MSKIYLFLKLFCWKQFIWSSATISLFTQLIAAIVANCQLKNDKITFSFFFNCQKYHYLWIQLYHRGKICTSCTFRGIEVFAGKTPVMAMIRRLKNLEVLVFRCIVLEKSTVVGIIRFAGNLRVLNIRNYKIKFFDKDRLNGARALLMEMLEARRHNCNQQSPLEISIHRNILRLFKMSQHNDTEKHLNLHSNDVDNGRDMRCRCTKAHYLTGRTKSSNFFDF